MSLHKRFAVLAVAIAASLMFLAACGSSTTTTKAAPATGTSTTDNVMTNLVGPGCAGYAKKAPDGKGSFLSMANDSVAKAVRNNPLLATLSAALDGGLNNDVNLADTLDGRAYTVFAPVDSAFAKLPAAAVQSWGNPAGAARLESILTYHLIAGKILPSDIDGTFKTVNGASVTIKGSGNDMEVGGGGAKVLCGGIKTANATVYLIDSVLLPPK